MAKNKLILGDCLDKMKDIEDSGYDVDRKPFRKWYIFI